MSGELAVDGRELLEMAEDAPEQVETILEMMIEAEEELFPDEEE
jgi:predicted ATP-grasp superfamily ATP-dependent carboligase